MWIQCDEVLNSLYTKASERTYYFIYCFRPTLVSLLLPLFASFSPIFERLGLIIWIVSGAWKNFWPIATWIQFRKNNFPLIYFLAWQSPQILQILLSSRINRLAIYVARSGYHGRRNLGDVAIISGISEWPVGSQGSIISISSMQRDPVSLS